MEDHYAILRVRPTATAQEIARAYRRLARANHPDLLRAAPPEARRRAEAALKRINRAHHVLGDRERRREYDRARFGRGITSPRPTGAADRPAPRATPRPPAAERTSHWGASGPIDIEWSAPPARAPRPEADLFSLRRLAWCALVLVLFTLALMLLWNPALGQPIPTPVPLPTP